MTDILNEIVRLARLSLSGRQQDIQLYIRRLAHRLKTESPETSLSLSQLINGSTSFDSPLRNSKIASVPVDRDSRLQLVKFEHPVQLEVQPILPKSLQKQLDQIINERKQLHKLTKAGISPTRTLIFSGQPGVGKTMAARWLASSLRLPLLILDLSAVMSSFLGRTGNNMRNVFDYAKGADCILLLDEFDTIAKRRDDTTEVGELKRLVNVLLQELDDWPPAGLLVAATNHAQLLDPAIWRRFDMLLEFPLPNSDQTLLAVKEFLGEHSKQTEKWHSALAVVLNGCSYSEVEREISNLRRNAIVREEDISEGIISAIRTKADVLSKSEKFELSVSMIKAGLSQRTVSEITGVSRDTIRKKHNLERC